MAASLQACGVVFPFAISTSICRSKFTICSCLYRFIGMTGLPPSEFSLISPGTKIPGQVRWVVGRHDLPCAQIRFLNTAVVFRIGSTESLEFFGSRFQELGRRF